MNIDLLKHEYNALYYFVSGFTETASKVVVSTVIEKIGEAVRSLVGEDKKEPESISISVTTKELSAIKAGFVSLVKSEKIDTNGVLSLLSLAKTLKIHGAFSDALEELTKELEEISTDISLDK